jgi:ABC-type nitrate/sulfonate/bicarbonate transport system permease component
VSVGLIFVIWGLIIRAFNVETFVAPSPIEALGAVRDNWSVLWPLALETVFEKRIDLGERIGLNRSVAG